MLPGSVRSFKPWGDVLQEGDDEDSTNVEPMSTTTAAYDNTDILGGSERFSPYRTNTWKMIALRSLQTLLRTKVWSRHYFWSRAAVDLRRDANLRES